MAVRGTTCVVVVVLLFYGGGEGEGECSIYARAGETRGNNDDCARRPAMRKGNQRTTNKMLFLDDRSKNRAIARTVEQRLITGLSLLRSSFLSLSLSLKAFAEERRDCVMRESGRTSIGRV